MNTERLRTTGRGWAYTGAVLGGAVSLAANVAHSYVPPPGAGAGWTPEAGAVVSATFWPVAVFVAVEILIRVTWPTGRPWLIARFLGVLPVALVAAVVSYRHLAGLLAHYGEDTLTAVIGPIAVDGLMVMATAALIATSSAIPARPRPAHADHAADDPASDATEPQRQAGLDARPTTAPLSTPRANGHAIGSGVAR